MFLQFKIKFSNSQLYCELPKSIILKISKVLKLLRFANKKYKKISYYVKSVCKYKQIIKQIYFVY